MIDAQRTSEKVTVYYAAESGSPITGEIDRSDPGDPNIRLEAGCNEFWLNRDEAQALLVYLQRTIPLLRGGEDG